MAGCGSGSSTTTSGSSGGTESSGGAETSGESSGGSSSGSLAKMEKNVEFLLGPKGTFKEEPTTSPVRAGQLADHPDHFLRSGNHRLL